MDQTLESFVVVIEESGWLAPLIFIALHVLRQVLFLPVLLVCLLGGYLFGMVYGTLYSVVGLTLMSMLFYFIAKKFPNGLVKLSNLKKRWFRSYHSLNMTQILLIRLLPFVHFHLISLYLMEMTNSFKEYAKYSFYASIPPALLFTAFGHIIHELPLIYALIIITPVLLCVHYFGKKRATYKWSEFFAAKAS
jgi:uncharacterized membrane protein YdjX (TVP38/TMEM64 family)